jgi:hypothetical protein
VPLCISRVFLCCHFCFARICVNYGISVVIRDIVC